MKTALRITFAAPILAMFWQGSLPAQCSMCRTAASAQGHDAASAVNLAIVILLLPALALFSGVYWLLFRRYSSVDGQ